jgi:hypothetical protein
MTKNLIEECGDFEAYARKYCPNDDFETQLKHLLELEDWMFVDKNMKEFAELIRVWYKSDIRKKIEGKFVPSSLLFSNVKLRKDK